MTVLGHALRYRSLGAGGPVALLHGLGGSGRWWDGVATALAREHRVLVPELPGFGHQPLDPGFRLAEAADVMARWLERLGVAPAAVAGHSLGALVAMWTAVRRPEAVARLVLVAPPVRTAGPRPHHHALPMLRTLAAAPPAAAAAIVRDVAGRPAPALLAAADEILAAGAVPDPASIAHPALLVQGARDRVVSPRAAAEFAWAMPRCRLVLLPRAGHVPMLDAPAAVAGALAPFLAEER